MKGIEIIYVEFYKQCLFKQLNETLPKAKAAITTVTLGTINGVQQVSVAPHVRQQATNCAGKKVSVQVTEREIEDLKRVHETTVSNPKSRNPLQKLPLFSNLLRDSVDSDLTYERHQM